MCNHRRYRIRTYLSVYRSYHDLPLQAATDKVSAMDDEAAKAHAFHDEVSPAMDALRAAADEAESIVDEDYWPLPCYSRMLFYTCLLYTSYISTP